MYFRSGLYYSNVKRYIDTFGRELVKVYLLEDLQKRPVQIYREVCNFLEVSSDFEPDFSAKNISKIPRFVPLQYLLAEFERFSKRHYRLCAMTRRLIQPLKKLNLRLGHTRRCPPGLSQQLRANYRDDILKLSELIGRDLSTWLWLEKFSPCETFSPTDVGRSTGVDTS